MKFKIFKLLLLGISVFLFVFGVVKFNNSKKNVESGLHSQTIKIEKGYGYQIANKNKVLIRQEYIPGLQGKKVFSRESDAKNVADLVLYKLNNKKNPVVFVKELDSLKVVMIN